MKTTITDFKQQIIDYRQKNTFFLLRPFSYLFRSIALCFSEKPEKLSAKLASLNALQSKINEIGAQKPAVSLTQEAAVKVIYHQLDNTFKTTYSEKFIKSMIKTSLLRPGQSVTTYDGWKKLKADMKLQINLASHDCILNTKDYTLGEIASVNPKLTRQCRDKIDNVYIEKARADAAKIIKYDNLSTDSENKKISTEDEIALMNQYPDIFQNPPNTVYKVATWNMMHHQAKDARKFDNLKTIHEQISKGQSLKNLQKNEQLTNIYTQDEIKLVYNNQNIFKTNTRNMASTTRADGWVHYCKQAQPKNFAIDLISILNEATQDAVDLFNGVDRAYHNSAAIGCIVQQNDSESQKYNQKEGISINSLYQTDYNRSGSVSLIQENNTTTFPCSSEEEMLSCLQAIHNPESPSLIDKFQLSMRQIFRGYFHRYLEDRIMIAYGENTVLREAATPKTTLTCQATDTRHFKMEIQFHLQEMGGTQSYGAVNYNIEFDFLKDTANSSWKFANLKLVPQKIDINTSALKKRKTS